MEPTSTPSRPHGPRGSLNAPEVYENVPGHIIPILQQEFEDFETEATKFLDGQTPEAEFIGFRLKQGCYGQRQPGVQMVRVKLPWGGVTPEQLEAFAGVAEDLVPKQKVHITTRQCIQMHDIPLKDMTELMTRIAEAGLSSREGCGNTVRNVTGDPWAGIAHDETFDPTPYAGAYVRYFVRHPTTQLMPRKVKTAFAASDSDRPITGIHDIAFIPRIRDGVKGFEIKVGGGTSIMPRIAPVLTEFATADDGEYLKIAEAVFRIFDRQDWLRVNRARARMKVFVDKYGIEELQKQVAEELKGDWVAERNFDPQPLLFVVDEEANAPAVPENPGQPTDEDRAAFEAFCDVNVTPQRQEGFSAVHLKVERGDLTPDQLRKLATITREYCNGMMRTTMHQNLVLRWVRDESVYDLWKALSAVGLDVTGADEVTDVVSCPGTDSCKMGITSSMGLNRAVQQRVEEMNITDPLTRKVHIKMSGCPNGCSQHHVGTIGFYGASIKVGEHTIPAYIPHIGGEFEDGRLAFGARLKLRMPAKRVPNAVERWLRMYEAERASDTETFKAYADRVGTKHFEDAAKDLAIPVDFSIETMQMFIDWSRDVPFVVQRGEGECAV